jgi:hypothetical protein
MRRDAMPIGLFHWLLALHLLSKMKPAIAATGPVDCLGRGPASYRIDSLSKAQLGFATVAAGT